MDTNKIKIAVSIEEANLILLALAERANKLEKGALKTRNHFYSEFAADRAREYEGLHNGILQQLIEMDMEPVSGHIASIPPVLHDEEEPDADLVRKVLEE